MQTMIGVGRGLSAGVALAALAMAPAAMAAPSQADAAQDARIARLEALVGQLAQQVADKDANVQAQAQRNAELQEEVVTLQAQIADLKASTASNIQDVRAAATANTVSLANGRPTFATADGQFTASQRGVFQLDTAHYAQRAPGPIGTDPRRGSFGDTAENERARDLNDGANFRRARLGIEGKAFGDFEYNFLYDFGGSGVEEAGKISAAWVQYNGLGKVRLRIGAFSPPAGLEEVTSTNGSLFAERASPSELVRSIASGDGRTAAAVFANGERWQASAAISGNVIGTQTFDEQLGFVGRFSFVPYKREADLVHLGVNSSIVIGPAATGPDVAPGVSTPIRLRERPELRVDGTRLVDTGNIDADGLTAIGLEFGAQHNNLALQAEYFDIRLQRRASALDDPRFHGWYVQGSWTITGEPRRYTIATGAFDSPRPAEPFSLKNGGWGAWELALRYSDLDLNYRELSAAATLADLSTAGSIRGGEQKIFTVGLNWYLNNVLRFQFAFQDVSVERLSPGGAAFGSGAATPLVGTQVGQDLQIWSLRTQYAF